MFFILSNVCEGGLLGQFMGDRTFAKNKTKNASNQNLAEGKSSGTMSSVCCRFVFCFFGSPVRWKTRAAKNIQK